MRPGTHGRCESVHDSLPKGSRKVDSLAYALPQFLEPRSWIRAVNHAPQKAQSLSCIVAVPADVVLCGLGTHPLQLRFFDWPIFQAQSDLIESPRVLAEAMIGGFGRFHLQM